MSEQHVGGFGAYNLLQRLSQGGMGDVFLARKTGAHGFEKLFAVKTLRPELAADDRYRRQFNDEARLVSRLVHPNIGQVFDYGEQAGTLYIVMEYVDGVSLSRLLSTHGRLEPRTAVELTTVVARALQHAHEALDSDGRRLGVVHRDVSPQNIMLTGEGIPKLIDFGIALMRNRESPETVDGVKGKVGYMSPEQLLGKPLDARTDVFSLGIVVYEMLTGRPLFAGDNVAVTVTSIMQGRIAKPSTVAADVPAVLDSVVMKALSQNADDRYRSAAELADALDGLASLAGQSLGAFAVRVVPTLRQSISVPRVSRATDTATRHEGAPMASAAARASSGIGIGAGPRAVAAQSRPRSPARRYGAIAAGTIIVAIGATLALGVAEQNAADAPRPEAVADLPLRALTEATPPAGVPTAASQPSEAKAATEHAAKAGHPTAANSDSGRRRARSSVAPEAVGRVAVSSGFVSLVAEPYALVRLDGIELGATPLLHHSVSIGQHRVEFVDPETAQVRATRNAVVDPDKETWVSIR